jgi:sulfur carrier protein
VITLVINGQDRTMDAAVTVADYLRSLKLDDQYIAVAHNGAVLAREQFSRVVLAEGDRVEIVRPVGGG